MTRTSIVSAATFAAIMTASVVFGPASAQRPAEPGAAASPPATKTSGPPADDGLAKNFQAEHEIGRRFHFDPANLPAPKTGPVVTDQSLTIPYSGQTLQVPPGFVATLFAKGLANPRRLLVLSNGDVLVAEQRVGYLTLLRDDGEGQAKWIDRHVEDLNKPYGLAWQGDNLLVADQDGIWRVPHTSRERCGPAEAGNSPSTTSRRISANRFPVLTVPR
jgi:glucose/arabinose dehydrogenase